MLKASMIIMGFLSVGAASAQGYQQRPYGTGSNPNSHYVQPHFRSDGTQGGGYYRTNPNQFQNDNFGARGNYNPYTGQSGGQRRSGQW